MKTGRCAISRWRNSRPARTATPSRAARSLQKLPVPTVLGWLQRWLYDLLAQRTAGRPRYFPNASKALGTLRAPGRRRRVRQLHEDGDAPARGGEPSAERAPRVRRTVHRLSRRFRCRRRRLNAHATASLHIRIHEPDLPRRHPRRSARIVAIYNSTVPSRQVTADLEPVTRRKPVAWFHAHGPQARPLWVVEEGGKVIAWLSFSDFYGRPAYLRTAEVSIYLDESARGKGLGKQLLQAAIDRRRRSGSIPCWASSSATTTRASAVRNLRLRAVGHAAARRGARRRRARLVILGRRLAAPRNAAATASSLTQERPMFVDSHCHINFEGLADRMPEVLDEDA